MNRWIDRRLAGRARVFSLVDALVPPALLQGNTEVRRRARLAVTAAMLGAVMVFINATYSLSVGLGRSVPVVNLALGVVFASMPIVFRRTQSVVLFTNALVAAGYLQLVILTVISGSTNLGAIYSFSVIPLAANLLAGWRAGLVWAVFCVAGVLLSTGPLATTPLAVMPLSPGEVPIAVIRDAVALTLGVAIFGGLYDRVRNLALRDAERARELGEASEEKFAQAFACDPNLLLIVALDDRTVVECNESLVRAFGAESRAALIGQPVFNLSPKLTRSDFSPLESRLRQSLRTREFELNLQMPEGSRSYLVSTAPLRVAKRDCLLLSAHDITSRKTLEDQLRQAQKMEAVGQLAGGIAHDFNNMLTVISGYADILLKRLEGDDREDVAQIAASATRSAMLTRRLLAFSRQQVLEQSVLDASELMQGMDDLLRRLIGETVQIVYDLEEEACSVFVDRGQIEQALVNMAINARDAMPDGGTLYLETRAVSLDSVEATRLELPPGDYVRLQVRDIGSGISPEIITRVLDPFFTTKAEGEGTGLGLSMAHGIARQSGGALSLDSERGVGTTASLYLPCASVAAGPKIDRGSGPGRAHVDRSGGETILVAEDEEMIRTLVTRTLAGAGYQVIIAEDGESALALARAHEGPIHLLLADVVMPRMGGPELAKRVQEERAELPVVLMSGYPDRAGADAEPLPEEVVLLRKPFTADGLMDCVAGVLQT